jgi:two-component system response regulator AlgR
LPIPPLMLQPLLENAVYHGIEPAPEGGTVRIAIAQHGDELVIAIANPTTGHLQHAAGNQIAVANIRERLALYYDLEARLEIEAAAHTYEVRIILPCRQKALKILLVDDEPLARDRLRTLLADIAIQLASEVVGEAGNGLEALAFLREHPVDVVLADIRMPGMDGIELAGHLGAFEKPPAVIFTTAYDNYAVQAFDLNAVDYLLKPVRTQRLLTALQKIPATTLDPAILAEIGRASRGSGRTHLSCHERGRLLLVPVSEVLYFKADLKYVTARTVDREYLLDEALTHLERNLPSVSFACIAPCWSPKRRWPVSRRPLAMMPMPTAGRSCAACRKSCRSAAGNGCPPRRWSRNPEILNPKRSLLGFQICPPFGSDEADSVGVSINFRVA